MCAFPLHVWTLLLGFQDIGWLTARTNAWDAVGVVAYGLVFAFVESVFLFLVMGLLGFLISLTWEQERRIAILTVLVLILSLWAMVSQLYFLLNWGLPALWVGLLIKTRHPFWVLSAAILMTVSFSFLVPTYYLIRSTPAFRFISGLIERLSLLTFFYLFLDVVGLLIVVIRNV